MNRGKTLKDMLFSLKDEKNYGIYFVNPKGEDIYECQSELSRSLV